MTEKQIRNVQKLIKAINEAEYNEGKDEFKGFKGCSRSDMEIIIDWVNQLVKRGRIESIEFDEPMKVMKKYNLDSLVN